MTWRVGCGQGELSSLYGSVTTDFKYATFKLHTANWTVDQKTACTVLNWT